jgi:hypothetical protein
MNILDLSNVCPLLFSFSEQPQNYNFEQPERLLALLKQVVVYPQLALLVDDYELEYYEYLAPEYITGFNAYGTALTYSIEPSAHRVTLHPRLFLLCLRCSDAIYDNQVHRDELIRHLEAEVQRRKLRVLIS